MLYRLGLQSRSKIDVMLEKYFSSKNNETSDLTLPQLMDQDDFVREIKSRNGKLYDFLSQEDSLLKLLKYIIEQPDAPDEEDSRNENFVKRIHRYPHLAFQVFQSYPECYAIIVTTPKLLNALFSFLDSSLPSENPRLYTYWIKIMLRLIDYTPEPLLEYIMAQENDFILQQLFNHLTMDYMVDLMLKLFMCDNFDLDQDQGVFQTPLRKFMMKSKNQIDQARRSTSDLGKKKQDEQQLTYFRVAEFWLEQNVLERCLALMRPEYDEETHICVQYLFSSILRRSFHFVHPSKLLNRLNPIAQKIISREFAEIYIRTILNFSDSSVISCGVELLSHYISFCTANNSVLQIDISKTDPSLLWPYSLQQCVFAILDDLPSFVSLLNDPPKVEPYSVATTFGVLDPPLGEIRLKVIEFLTLLFHSPMKETAEALIKSQVLESITNLFFKYEFNNLLHNQFLKIISYILSRDSLELKQSLFKDCKIVERILAAHRLNEETCANNGIRKGYMGHLITISNTIVTIAKSQHEIQETILESEDWQAFVENELAERNLIQTTNLGGSHPMTSDFGDINEHFRYFDDEIDESEFHQGGIPVSMSLTTGVDDVEDDDLSDDTDSTDSSDDDTIIRRRGNSSDDSDEGSPLTDESPIADESPLVEEISETLNAVSLSTLPQQEQSTENTNHNYSNITVSEDVEVDDQEAEQHDKKELQDNEDNNVQTFNDFQYWNSSDLTAFDINL